MLQGASTELIALVAAVAAVGGGWFVLHGARLAFDYMSTRGNPRNRAQAHESGRDLIIGALILAGCVGGAALAVFGIFQPF